MRGSLLKTYTFHKMLGGKVVAVSLGIIFFLMYGCGEQKEPAKPSQPLGPPSYSKQQEFIDFPGLGVLEVKAQAVEGQLPKLVMTNAEKKVLLELEMGATDEDPDNFKHYGRIEFMARHIPGLPDPLLMAVATGSGGSARPWEMALIGVVSGNIKLLWKDAVSDHGGFFVGDLGKNRGPGIAQWDWSSSECHACEADRYYVKLNPWNKEKAQFEAGSELTIEKKKFDDIKKLGLDFPDQKEDFETLFGPPVEK